ncbi:pentatricopeptide repeat (PPR) superfamily protein [Wolffia australiana]
MARRNLHLAAEAAAAASTSSALRSSKYGGIRASHAQLLKSGADISGDALPAAHLVSSYSALGRFSDALLLLDESKDPDPWRLSSVVSSLSKSGSPRDASAALTLYRRMLRAGYPPNSFLLPSLLKACAALRWHRAGGQLHALASVSGCVSEDPFVQTSLVHMYLRCGRANHAQRVFETMTSPSVVSWSAMIGGYARTGCPAEALDILDRMRASGVEPNVATWNGMIAGFGSSGLSRESARALEAMHLQGFTPDGATFSSVLPALAQLEDALAGMQAHAYIFKLGLASADACVVSALVAMYGKCRLADEMVRAFEDGTGRKSEADVGCCNALVSGLSLNNRAGEALRWFREFERGGLELNVVSWTSIVACCAQNGEDAAGLDLFAEMQAAGVRPNSVTVSCVLPACANTAALGHGKSVHGFSLRNGMTEGVYVRSSLVDMYAKCGRIVDARRVFDDRPRPRNVVSWNAMLGGYAVHGKAREAARLFEEMSASGQRPDAVTFTCLLAACSQAGLTERGLAYFEAMSREYGVAPRMEHYACVVSMLGRAGDMERARALIGEMPMEPDACVWGALLGACRLHGSVALGEMAAHKLFELEPRNVGNYVLLCHIYAAKGLRGAVDGVRDRMRALGLRKNPGCSWIELKEEGGFRVHALLAGDRSHPRMGQILDKLARLGEEMSRLGHSPSTELVLQDVEEQDKEHILCGHSEKLAVALGLLSTPPGTPLRVIKNLRICADCHAAIKFISLAENRQIFVRDTYRFHHFHDGRCSCGDYCQKRTC